MCTLEIDIKTYRVTTDSGRCREKLDFLTDKQQADFDSIGYSGKTVNGVTYDRVPYLDNLVDGDFALIQTRWVDGDPKEEFILIRVTKIYW